MNFLDRYLYAAGESEVPVAFHFWCGIATLAAAVADRVVLDESVKGRAMAPNLYTILFGPSAVGKGEAIDFALRVLGPFSQTLNVLRGRFTHAAILDHLGSKSPDEPKDARTLLVTPELAMSFGTAQQAQELVKLLTDLYTGSTMAVTDSTRTHGRRYVTSPTVNWLAGTTKAWFTEAIPRSYIDGGFAGRLVMVTGEPSKTPYPKPVFPPDRADVIARLQDRVQALTVVSGTFTLSAEADEFHTYWYNQRWYEKAESLDQDDRLVPTFRRHDDLLYKLAMLLALAESETPAWVIEKPHLVRASMLLNELWLYAKDVIDYLSATPDTAAVLWLQRYVRQHRTVDWFAISRRGTASGYTSAALWEAAKTLVESRRIRVVRTKTGGHRVMWRDKRAKAMEKAEMDATAPPPEGDEA